VAENRDKEKREIARDRDTRVTVMYRMSAASVEVKK
jgi:hypothetical protein